MSILQLEWTGSEPFFFRTNRAPQLFYFLAFHAARQVFSVFLKPKYLFGLENKTSTAAKTKMATRSRIIHADIRELRAKSGGWFCIRTSEEQATQ